MARKDFLDELVEQGAKRDPKFASMVDAAYERRRQARKTTAKVKRSETDESLSSERREDEQH